MIPSVRRSIFLCSIVCLLSADLAVQALNPQLVPNNTWQLPFLLGQIIRPSNSPLLSPADRPGGDDQIPSPVRPAEDFQLAAQSDEAVREYLSALSTADFQSRTNHLLSSRDKFAAVSRNASNADAASIAWNMWVIDRDLGRTRARASSANKPTRLPCY